MVYSIKKVWKFFMTRDKLIAVAEKLFAKYGYDYTSLSQIAEETGIRKASVYAHFASKAELFLMIYQQTHDRTLAQIRETYEDDRLKCSEKMKKIFKCICRSESLGFFRATMFPPIELKSETLPIFFDFENDVKKMLSATILEAQQNGELRGYPVENIIDMFFYVLDGLMAKSLFYTVTEYRQKVEMAWSMFWESIAAPE